MQFLLHSVVPNSFCDVSQVFLLAMVFQNISATRNGLDVTILGGIEVVVLVKLLLTTPVQVGSD